VSAGAVLAERGAPNRTQLLDERGAWLSHNFAELITIEEPESTGGVVYTANIGSGYPYVAPVVRFWGGSRWVSVGGGQTQIILLRHQPYDLVALAAPDEADFTLSPSAPMFEVPLGTGEMISDIRDYVRELWHRYAAPGGPLPLDAPTPVLDIPAALQQARSQAGLPVQDLAAMFGIKRRQFYNLTSGEQQPEPDREPRITRVTDAINKVSEWVGNSRKVRALLLARIDGDSIYDAAVADDEGRLRWALERAYSAAAQDISLPTRLSPSHRATLGEAAAVRDYLRATRDDTGAANDR
jgi:hypothetical protein